MAFLYKRQTSNKCRTANLIPLFLWLLLKPRPASLHHVFTSLSISVWDVSKQRFVVSCPSYKLMASVLARVWFLPRQEESPRQPLRVISSFRGVKNTSALQNFHSSSLANKWNWWQKIKLVLWILTEGAECKMKNVSWASLGLYKWFPHHTQKIKTINHSFHS